MLAIVRLPSQNKQRNAECSELKFGCDGGDKWLVFIVRFRGFKTSLFKKFSEEFAKNLLKNKLKRC